MHATFIKDIFAAFMILLYVLIHQFCYPLPPRCSSFNLGDTGINCSLVVLVSSITWIYTIIDDAVFMHLLDVNFENQFYILVYINSIFHISLLYSEFQIVLDIYIYIYCYIVIYIQWIKFSGWTWCLVEVWWHPKAWTTYIQFEALFCYYFMWNWKPYES